MVVDYLHLMRVHAIPDKADTPSIIDANAMLALSIARKSLQTISGRHPQIIEIFRVVEN